MSFKKEHKLETLIYLGLWTMLFIAPVISLSVRTANTDMAFDWEEVLVIWKQYAPFFFVFLIHNHLLAPILVYRQQIKTYLALSLGITAIFAVYQCNHHPRFDRNRPQFERMAKEDRPPLPPESGEEPQDSIFPLNDSVRIAQYDPDDYRPKPIHGKKRINGFRHGKGFRHGDGFRPGDGPGPGNNHPPVIFGQHNVIALIILILMLGMNLGIKLYFKQRSDQRKMDHLEKENLEQQLEYLKYQINPHFFMNTLNNIHALVDIDPEKAKQTILELSKMMRFVLYEGNKKGVPLDREIAFMHNYVTLMKLRYTDKVSITIDTPSKVPSKEVPPLMFITFVENAFKHGVSYRQASFINVSLRIENNDQLVFTCKNSKIPKEEDKHGGVGLANVKQRLDLIYGTRYTLDIQDEQDTYTVNLTIPL